MKAHYRFGIGLQELRELKKPAGGRLTCFLQGLCLLSLFLLTYVVGRSL